MNIDRNNIKTIKIILANIIKNQGGCDGFSITRWCIVCPFGNASQRADGSFYSCVEYLLGSNIWASSNTYKMDAVYLERAERLLADIEVEEILLRGNLDD